MSVYRYIKSSLKGPINQINHLVNNLGNNTASLPTLDSMDSCPPNQTVLYTTTFIVRSYTLPCSNVPNSTEHHFVAVNGCRQHITRVSHTNKYYWKRRGHSYYPTGLNLNSAITYHTCAWWTRNEYKQSTETTFMVNSLCSSVLPERLLTFLFFWANSIIRSAPLPQLWCMWYQWTLVGQQILQ